MPSIITFGAASGRGFGATNKLPPVLTTTTFTSSGNWIAPLSVTSIATLSGTGQNGSPVPLGITCYYNTDNSNTSLPNPAYAFWQDIYGTAVTYRNIAIAAIGSFGPSNFLRDFVVNVGPGDTWNEVNTFFDLSPYIVTGVGDIFALAGSPQTTGPIYYPPGYNVWAFVLNFQTPGFQGSSSTAIGKTFPGGNGTTSPTTTFTDVAVTPGVSYPISVAPGGSVTLQYYI